MNAQTENCIRNVMNWQIYMRITIPNCIYRYWNSARQADRPKRGRKLEKKLYHALEQIGR
ncbi:MAG: hypothetical protein HFH50_16570 [Lachnospiraceae bacterium]|jgi:hypothetical protein|nr:hypothetical protein [Lachnospiraceae bacterium]